MVQVDIFWAYGLGAGLAAAAGPQILEKESKDDSAFYNSYFVKTLLFLSLIWAPTGLLLLLRHPSWECMQYFNSFAEIPPWLILAFGFTNISQGILGFWTSKQLFKHKKIYAAHLNWLFGYFGMFFILLYGWDGLGYDRFWYDRDSFGGIAWYPGAFKESGFSFLASSVAQTLYLDGLYLLPPLFFLVASWIRERFPDKSDKPPITGIIIWKLGGVFGIAFLQAFLCAFTVFCVNKLFGGTTNNFLHVLSYFIGIPLCLLISFKLLYKKNGFIYKYLMRYN